MLITSLPKIELHYHLDCSLSYDVVNKINPSISREEYDRDFVMQTSCRDLAGYLKVTTKCSDLMQSRESLRWTTEDAFQQFKKDNIIYAEIRFAPLLHLNKGLSPSEVVQIINSSVEDCILKYGIEVNIILCTLRHFTEEQSMQTVNLVQLFKNTRVVGLDLAADEAGYPIDPHVSAFKYAQENNIHVTAHAGEAKGPESVWETMDRLKVARIGHGVNSIHDLKLVDYLIDQDIHLEICPTSNVKTDIVDSVHKHPINALYNHGVSLSVNTDARSIMELTLDREYQNLIDAFRWDKAHFLKCNLEAIRHAFITEEKKDELRKVIVAAYST